MQVSTLDHSGKVNIAQSLNNAMLWHKRLRYVSEKGFSELSK